MALDEQNWPTKPITSPEALLSFNRMAILWGNRGSKVVGITYSQSRDVPSDGRDSGREKIKSLRRMRLANPLGCIWDPFRCRVGAVQRRRPQGMS